MHFVYLLHNTATSKFYIGETSNINTRVKSHQSGRNIATKYQSHAWRLIYTEVYRSKKDALLREKKLKAHGFGLAELKKRITNSLLDQSPKLGLGGKSEQCAPTRVVNGDRSRE